MKLAEEVNFYKKLLKIFLLQKIFHNKDNKKRTPRSVGWRTYYLYFTGGGRFFGICGAFLVFLLFIASQSLMIATDYWLSYWYIIVIFSVNLKLFFSLICKYVI